MPLLPNLGEVPQPQFDRIVAAFPGANNAEKVAAYRRWLTNRLIERVEQVEFQRIDEQMAARKVAAYADVRASLPAGQPEPELPA